MYKYLFFLIILLIPVGLASAETGKNFDTIENQDGTTTWSSHYERVWVGSTWGNYLIDDTTNSLEFEGSGIHYIFDKLNCDFKLYDTETETLVINSYQFNLLVDGIAEPS